MGIASAESAVGENIGLQLGMGEIETTQTIHTGIDCRDKLQAYLGRGVLLSHHKDGEPLMLTVEALEHDYDAYAQMDPAEVLIHMQRARDIEPSSSPVLPSVGILGLYLPDYFVVTPIAGQGEPPRVSSYWSEGNQVHILKQGTLGVVSKLLRAARDERRRQADHQNYPNFSKTRGPVSQ